MLAQREELALAIEAFEASKLEALSAALRSALRSGFARSNLHLSSARHGVIALRQPARTPALLHAVEAATKGCKQLAVHTIGDESGGALHVRNLIQRAAASTETLLLIMGQEQLDELMDTQASSSSTPAQAVQACGGASAWRSFAYLSRRSVSQEFRPARLHAPCTPVCVPALP